MADKTSIEWTRSDDGTPGASWNPVRGCSRISPGCGGPFHQGGCYAEKIAARFSGHGQPFHGFATRDPVPRWTGKMALIEDQLDLPLRWRRPRRVFVNSMSDLFHENLSHDAIRQVFAVMALADRHTFQVLTKRARGMLGFLIQTSAEQVLDMAFEFARGRDGQEAADFWNNRHGEAWPLPGVILGVSIEDQKRADERFPIIAEIARAGWRTMVSMEPLLEQVHVPDCYLQLGARAWVIIGGESGLRSRTFNLAWARMIIRDCQDAGVPVFFKQAGSRPATFLDNGSGPVLMRLNDPKGGEPDEWPADLRVRQFPA